MSAFGKRWVGALVLAAALATQLCAARAGPEARGSRGHGRSEPQTIGDDPQRAALLALFQNTGGTLWARADGWNSSGPVCSWFGVRCDVATGSFVTELSLSSNNLVGTVPEELGQLGSLQVLNLSLNAVVALPQSLGNLKRLRELNLTSNALSALPDSLGGLGALEVLAVARNSLASLPSSLGQLSALRVLHASNNHISALPDSLGSVTTLQEILLEGNALSSLPSSVQRLSQLKSVGLSSNKFAALPAELLTLCGHLTDIHISSNPLSALPAGIGACQNLTLLSASHARLTALPDEIGALRSVKYLSVYDNLLTELPATIGGMASLEMLYAFNNRLTALPPDIGRLSRLSAMLVFDNELTALPAEIGDLPALAYLSVFANSLTALPPEIGRISTLTTLFVSNNQLSALPKELGLLTNLTDLNAWGNRLSTLPSELSHIPMLRRLYLRGNALTALDASLVSMASLERLDVSSNMLTSLGPPGLAANSFFPGLLFLNASFNPIQQLPDAFWRANLSLTALDLTGIAAPIDLDAAELSSWRMPHLSFLSISGNRQVRGSLDGLLRLLAPSAAALDDLRAFATTLTGALSPRLLNFTALVNLDLADCQLVGDLPQWFFTLPSLLSANLQSNRISSIAGGAAIADGTSSRLQTLSLARNALGSQDVCALLYTLSASTRSTRSVPRSSLVRVDLSDNALTGPLYYDVTSIPDAGAGPSSVPCRFLDAGAYFNRLDALQELALGGNALQFTNSDFVGILDAMTAPVSGDAAAAPRRLELDGNPALAIQGAAGLEWVTPLRFHEDRNLLCMQPRWSLWGVEPEGDPSQFAYEHCTCSSQATTSAVWLARSQRCEVLPSRLKDSVAVSTRVAAGGQQVRVAVLTGFYPVLAGSVTLLRSFEALGSFAELAALRCHDANACNPGSFAAVSQLDADDYSASFACASHFDDSSLLCSRCARGAYAVAGRCVPCFPGAAAVSLLFSVLAGAAVLAWAWRRKATERGATVTICFFYLQLSEALDSASPESSSGAAAAASSLSALSAVLYFRPFALECIVPGADATTALAGWIMLPVIVAAACAVVAWMLERRAVAVDSGGDTLALRRKAFAAWLTLIALAYLPLTRSVLQAFNKEHQDGAPPFVSAAPYIAWDSREHDTMVALATIGLIYVLGVPALLFALARRAALSAAPSDDQGYAFLLSSVRDQRGLWWWESLVVNGRRLFVAALVALSPWRSEWLPFIMLLALILLQLGVTLVQPYHHDFDNRLETTLLVTAAALYAGHVAGNANNLRSSEGLQELVFVASAVVKSLVLGLVLVTAAYQAQAAAQRGVGSLRQMLLRGDGGADRDCANESNGAGMESSAKASDSSPYMSIRDDERVL